MAPSKFMLYLSSGSIAPALELLRRVCQPSSRSLPHITARYSSRAVRPEVLEHYSNALIDDLILASVTAFDPPETWNEGISTLIVKCESEDLEWLSYKPDFPDSVFHFTVYDGQKSLFALSVMRVMQGYPWNLRLVGSQERVEPYEKSRSAAPRGDEPALSPSAKVLFQNIAKTLNLSDSILDLTNAQRLRVVEEICEYIHSSPEVTSAGDHPIDLVNDVRLRYADRQPRWAIEPIDELSPHLVGMPDERESAMFLTPPELAYDMARAALEIVPDESITFGDPAVGPGIFFAALRQLSRGRRIGSAVGVEIDPARAEETARRWRRAGLRVVVGDFLTRLPPSEKWTLTLANPPYVRHQEIDRPLGWLREALYERTGIRIDGRSDLYMYFVLSAHDWLADGAVASWLLPSEFASTDFGQALRDYLTSKVTLRRIHFYDPASPLFENARVSSSVVTYVRSQPDGGLVRVSQGGTLDRPDRMIDISIETLVQPGKWNWLTLTEPRDEAATTIGDIFEVKRGIATGANEEFLLRDHQLQELKVQDDWVKPVVPRSRTLESPIIEGDHRCNPKVASRLWLIDSAEPIEQIRQLSQEFATYLEGVQQRVGARSLIRARRPFYKQESRLSPIFVFKYMAKSDLNGSRRFIWNQSRAVALNNYLGLRLRPEVEQMVSIDPSMIAVLFDALRQIPAEEFQRHGRTYTSGLLKLEPKDLARVRIDLPRVVTPGLI